MASPRESWRSEALSQIRLRNKLERDQFRGVFKTVESLLQQSSTLRQRCYQLEQEVQSKGLDSPMRGGGGGALEDKLLKLQEELTASYRLSAEHSSTLLRLKLQAEKDEKALLQKEEELIGKAQEVSVLRDQNEELEERVRHLATGMDVLKRELDTSRETLVSCEKKMRELGQENNVLIERLLAIKNEQAKEINAMNDMYESLVKQASSNSEMIRRVEEKKLLEPNTEYSDAAASSTPWHGKAISTW